ncbi:hypothetical protein TeGR_g5778 [Tetraparma gracilis]|uniref:Uncharacterized protein n=1 Tax=Tetraparma gracilis TaxID=2962635 RepID=A0ABQ6MHC5_9STRA|nr:hypothetical protein TeGR_g5778 [Tetraparma gracilis]
MFNNPLAPPVHASQIPSARMPPRDLTYVVSSMLRPLQMSDPYNEDHYFHRYRESETRRIAERLNLPVPPQLAQMTPLPAMFRQKVMQAKKEKK